MFSHIRLSSSIQGMIDVHLEAKSKDYQNYSMLSWAVLTIEKSCSLHLDFIFCTVVRLFRFKILCVFLASPEFIVVVLFGFVLFSLQYQVTTLTEKNISDITFLCVK